LRKTELDYDILKKENQEFEVIFINLFQHKPPLFYHFLKGIFISKVPFSDPKLG